MDPPTLMAYELDEPFAALISSSARHSAMDLTFRKADSRVCQIDQDVIFFVLNSGDTYTSGQEGDSLVHPSKRGHINSLTTDSSL